MANEFEWGQNFCFTRWLASGFTWDFVVLYACTCMRTSIRSGLRGQWMPLKFKFRSSSRSGLRFDNSNNNAHTHNLVEFHALHELWIATIRSVALNYELCMLKSNMEFHLSQNSYFFHSYFISQLNNFYFHVLLWGIFTISSLLWWKRMLNYLFIHLFILCSVLSADFHQSTAREFCILTVWGKL